MKIKSVVSFLERIAEHEDASMFRGQSNAEWELVPALGRLSPDEFPLRLSGWDATENYLLEEFKKHASRHLKTPPKNKLEWLIHAQHHGLPTRLLDWSTNPLKALYFTVENSEYDHVDGKVFCHYPRMWSSSSDLIGDIERDNLNTAFYPVMINDRVLAQEGCFTLFAQRKSFEKFEIMTEGLSLHPTVGIHSITIKREIKSDLRKGLDCLGVSDMTLFPGLDGISKKIRRDFGAFET